jgi:hypothetical protein
MNSLTSNLVTSHANFIPNDKLDPIILNLLKSSNLELKANSKIRIIYLQKIGALSSTVVLVDNESKTFKQEFKSVNGTAKYFNVSNSAISKALDLNKPLTIKGENYYLKKQAYKFPCIFLGRIKN